MNKNKERTAMFEDVKGVVGFIDGKMVGTINDPDELLQNRDYNGW